MEKIYELPTTAKQIPDSKDFIDIDGTIYTPVTNYKNTYAGYYHKKTCHIVHGYQYCGIYYESRHKCIQKRVHRLIAEAFIPNPQDYPIVGHKNNIKSDNRIENLYWTTNKENIQKAVDDGLLKNDKGFQDSQSKPVIMYETTTNKKIQTFGSIIEASKHTGIPKNTIARQAKYHRPVRKPYYFRYTDDDTVVSNNIVGMYSFDDDKLIKTFFSIANAAKETHSNEKTISQQCHKGKPKVKFSDYYFGFVNTKCEQTIERKKQVE